MATSSGAKEDSLSTPPRRIRFGSQTGADGVETLSAARNRRRAGDSSQTVAASASGGSACSSADNDGLLSDTATMADDSQVPLDRQGVHAHLRAMDSLRDELLALRTSLHGDLARHAEAVRDLGASLETQLDRAEGTDEDDAGMERREPRAPGGQLSEAQQEAARQARLRRTWSQPAFRPRASLLTTMLEGRRDYRTIYSMAVAGMAWLGINMVVQAAFQLQRQAERPGESDQGWACGGSGRAWAAHAPTHGLNATGGESGA